MVRVGDDDLCGSHRTHPWGVWQARSHRLHDLLQLLLVFCQLDLELMDGHHGEPFGLDARDPGLQVTIRVGSPAANFPVLSIGEHFACIDAQIQGSHQSVEDQPVRGGRGFHGLAGIEQYPQGPLAAFCAGRQQSRDLLVEYCMGIG